MSLQQENQLPIKTLTAIVITLVIIMVGTTDLHIPSLPAITKALHTSVSSVQLTVTFYLIGYGISPVIYGPLSDKLGRKVILCTGLFIAIIGSLFCLSAGNIEMLLTGRAIQGLGMGAGSAMMRAIFRDAFTGTALARAGAQLGMATSLSLGLAPTLVGFIQDYLDWRVNFVIIFISMIVFFIVVLLKLPETNQQRDKASLHPVYWIKCYLTLICAGQFVIPVLLSGLAFSGLIVYITIAPFLFQQTMHLSPNAFGLLALVIAAAQFIGFTSSSKLLKKFSVDKTMFIGLLLMLLAGILLTLISLVKSAGILDIMLMIALYVIGASFIFPTSFSKAFTPFGHIIGFAAALYGLIQTLTAGLTSFILAFLPSFSALTMGLALTILPILSLLGFCLMQNTIKTE
ncbi:multidrug effflux MFS transporter [Facilibium subflavum]|uniref:multidrug effflux MFS transporter n=1 Tax=Facilibium subflavum TaxID=2219058 RepID=UPI000E654067|nr:multidrug effflux MFS transporter [Facilibium subflavum]